MKMKMKMKMKLMLGDAAVPHPKFHRIHLLLSENDSGLIWMIILDAQPISTLSRNSMLFRSALGGRHSGITNFMNPENFGLRKLKYGG
jgi:hypothetical protein